MQFYFVLRIAGNVQNMKHVQNAHVSYFANFPARLRCFTETYTRSFVHILQIFHHALNVLRKPMYTLLCSYFANFPAHLKCLTETYLRSFVHILQIFLHTLNVLRKPIHAPSFIFCKILFEPA